MALRLLKKEDIALAKSADRSKEIAEGLKISRRVDSLRQLQAEEERILEKFRIETLSHISKEINDLDAEKEKVKETLKSLADKAQKELSKTDKKRLEDFKKSLDERELFIKERSFELNLKEVDIAVAKKEYGDSLVRAKTHEEITNNLHRDAERVKEEAQQTLTTAQSMEKQAIYLKDKTERELAIRERELSERAKQTELQWEENLNTSRSLKQEKIRVADREATLEREIQRIRKNRL